MSEAAPALSVVMATHGRGEHIAPSIESVLRQTRDDLELIVVGDGPNEPTRRVAEQFDDPRVRWIELAENSGGQSAPNNAGIAAARGEWVAYLGHDDVWSPGHLEAIASKIAPDVDVVVSGCVFHGPPGSDTDWVTGIFEDPGAAETHFFPPSSVAHRRELTERIGPWRAPRSIPDPVDVELQRRAWEAGARFASTGRVTVHKFAAGHRYLAYLRPGSDEQVATLAIGDDELASIVEGARAGGRFMTMAYTGDPARKPGDLFARIRREKGLEASGTQRLTERVVIPQSDDPRSLDWHPLAHAPMPVRWSGPNPRPRILLPFTGTRARVELVVAAMLPGADLGQVRVLVEETPVGSHVEVVPGELPRICFEAELGAATPTVVTLETPDMFSPADLDPGSRDDRRLGIAVAETILTPLQP